MLELIGRGLTNAEIAHRLFVSPATAKGPRRRSGLSGTGPQRRGRPLEHVALVSPFHTIGQWGGDDDGFRAATAQTRSVQLPGASSAVNPAAHRWATGNVFAHGYPSTFSEGNR